MMLDELKAFADKMERLADEAAGKMMEPLMAILEFSIAQLSSGWSKKVDDMDEEEIEEVIRAVTAFKNYCEFVISMGEGFRDYGKESGMDELLEMHDEYQENKSTLRKFQLLEKLVNDKKNHTEEE